MRGGCVTGDVHDVCLSQIARGVIVAFHELAGAAGVLRSLGCGRWPVRVVSRDALAAEPPRRRTRNERGKHPVRGVRSKDSKARDAPARGGQRETSFGGCAPDRPPRWGSSRCKPKSRVSLHRRGRRGRGRQPRRSRSRRTRARGQGKERGWRRNEWQTWLGRVCARARWLWQTQCTTRFLQKRCRPVQSEQRAESAPPPKIDDADRTVYNPKVRAINLWRDISATFRFWSVSRFSLVSDRPDPQCHYCHRTRKRNERRS